MRLFRKLPLFLFIAMITSCQQDGKQLHIASMQDIKEWILPEYSLKSRHIREQIYQLAQEAPAMYADAYTTKYYKEKGRFVWITRHGIDEKADTLLSYLRKVEEEGFNTSSFYVTRIEQDLQNLRNRKDSPEDINQLMGRLEFNLTKALLRYATGQRYGFIQPSHVLNNIESEKSYPEASQRHHFGIHAEMATDSFYTHALEQARSEELGTFLREIQPQIPLYKTLKQEYLSAKEKGDTERARLAWINMERARWRYPRPQDKYIWVNLAGFQLTAVNEKKDSSLTMRICGGAIAHKSPLLTSKISRLELNPYWNIPPSIIRHEIAPLHTGDTAYFARHRYEIIDKKTGGNVNPASLSSAQLNSGQYVIRQTNGGGNSLGRIIFRFPNNYSVYLHDTNMPSAFRLATRAVSHGCIRLEKPLDLAFFIMEDLDSIQQDRIRMEIGKAPVTQWGKRYRAQNPQTEEKPKHKFYPVESGYSVFLDYYTLYPNREGVLEEHPDNYHYDTVLEKALNRF
ncbi:MAG: L,D-transpeptidase family protein [Bacteroidaceae bacterium]|nr:L,D-transpeptidase family protein [Bacteroidaceae bacterium]